MFYTEIYLGFNNPVLANINAAAITATVPARYFLSINKVNSGVSNILKTLIISLNYI